MLASIVWMRLTCELWPSKTCETLWMVKLWISLVRKHTAKTSPSYLFANPPLCHHQHQIPAICQTLELRDDNSSCTVLKRRPSCGLFWLLRHAINSSISFCINKKFDISDHPLTLWLDMIGIIYHYHPIPSYTHMSTKTIDWVDRMHGMERVPTLEFS